MLYKEDWERSKQRFEALWNRELVDRCCVSVVAPKKCGSFAEEIVPENYRDRVRYWTDPEWILNRNVQRMENTYFGGDAIPMIWLNVGPCGLAADFGSEYTFAEKTTWFDAVLPDGYTKPLSFNPQSKLLNITKELATHFSKEGKGKFFVSMPDNTSAIDTMAHIRGSENVLEDFITEPDNLKAALKIVTKAWLDTNEFFYDITTQCNEGGTCVGWLNTWAPGKHAQIQCDISVMISPCTFEEFIFEELEQACKSMEYSLYHFDGIEQLRHLDILLTIKELDMIQWTSVVGQPPPTEFIPALKKIQAAGKCLLINTTPDNIKPLLSNLSPRGLYFVTGTSTEEEARDLVKMVEVY